MTPRPATPLRWQFSLRAILVLMLGVGAALTIYRLPWVEHHQPVGDPFAAISTTYRRGWYGQPLKHGLCQQSADIEEFYCDDELIWRVSRAGGQVQTREHFRGGKLQGLATYDGGRKQVHFVDGKKHGPYVDANAGVRGHFWQGEPDGEWIAEGDATHVRNYRRGKLHGPWSWSQPGKVSCTATFDSGVLTEWNGQPVRQALRDWLTARHFPQDTIALLERPLGDFDLENYGLLMSQVYELPLRDSNQKLVLLSTPRWWSDLENFDSGRPIGEAFLEYAVLHGYHLCAEFGVLGWTGIPPLPDDAETTGVTRIAYEPNSPQAAEWLAPIQEEFLYLENGDARDRLQKLFAGTSIRINAERFGGKSPSSLRYHHGNPATTKLARRDWFGLILTVEGWTCEQTGDVLQIFPTRP